MTKNNVRIIIIIRNVFKPQFTFENLLFYVQFLFLIKVSKHENIKYWFRI